jgi:hypothetical protein
MNSPVARDECLVYGSSIGGHRLAYMQLLAGLFGLTIADSLPNIQTALRLINTRKLLFSTLDDSLGLFVFVSFVRSLLLRRTVGLFLSPHSCFDTEHKHFPTKLLLFMLLKWFPRLTIATITPYEVAPEFRRVSHVGLHDPQYWDKTPSPVPPEPPTTELSQRLVQMAGQRMVLGHIGLVSKTKGTDFLADFLERHPDTSAEVFVACVGDVREGEEALANRLRASGAFILGRHATDDEIESLYGTASVIWCCYPPDFDRASGVFGRALQYGVDPLIRTGSNIHRLSRMIGESPPTVEFGDDLTLARILPALSRKSTTGVLHQRKVATSAKIFAWRTRFIDLLSKRL